MARRPLIQPKWLDEMLWRWGQDSLRRESRMLGWYSICPMLKEGIPTQARSYEPTGVAPWEFEELEAHINALEPKFVLVLVRAYRPWAAPQAEERLAGYGGIRMWQRWLHEAVAQLASRMERTTA